MTLVMNNDLLAWSKGLDEVEVPAAKERNVDYSFDGVTKVSGPRAPVVLMVAGGTGGHVFPAIAVAKLLEHKGYAIHWLGTKDSFEAGQCAQHNFTFHTFNMSGVRGKGIFGWLSLFVRLPMALLKARQKLTELKPTCVVAMGGYVSPPAGIAAWSKRIPLVIHEQNAVAGLSNRLLARFAKRVCLAYPNELSALPTAVLIGNPLRQSFTHIEHPKTRLGNRTGSFRLLIVGGSLGAKALNETLPPALQALGMGEELQVWHQTGRHKLQETAQLYRQFDVKARTVEFIDDMSDAYEWADLIVCRAGALTISEISLVGIPSVLVPFPHAVDDHQTKNAEYLSKSGAAELIAQNELTSTTLCKILKKLFSDRRRLAIMASRARAASEPDAAVAMAAIIQEVRSA